MSHRISRWVAAALLGLTFVSGAAHSEWWCGQQGSAMSGWIPDQPRIGVLRKSSIDFRGTCMRHDVCYTSKGSRKADCDSALRSEMTAKCDSQYRTAGGDRASCLAVARIYYEAVTSGFGIAAFALAQARHRNDHSNPSNAGGGWIDVSARRPWNPTGVRVPNGSSIEIQAQGRAAIDTDGAFASPDGSGRGIADATSLLAGAPLHSLICKVGSGRPFYVGSSYKGVVDGQGQLACGMNEQPATNSSYRDNGGGWRLLVRF